MKEHLDQQPPSTQAPDRWSKVDDLERRARSSPRRAAPARERPGATSTIGMALLLLSVGPLFLLLNGGYSIQGMAWLADHLGEYGRVFWSLSIYWTVPVPLMERAGLPLDQPIVPWMMVVAITFQEIGLLLRRRAHRRHMAHDLTGELVSVFDYATTALGLSFAPFVLGVSFPLHMAWAIIAFILALPLTFGFEALLVHALPTR